MKDVILVSPRFARWPDDARTVLHQAGIHVVRLTDLGTVGVMMLAGEIDAVLVDHRCLGPSWRSYLSDLTRLCPRTRVVFIRDADDPPFPADDAVTWPDDRRAAAVLLGL